MAKERIVVGVDGSASSQQALDWAARQAELTGSSLEAVIAWQWPMSYGYALPVPDNFDPGADAGEVLRKVVDPVVASRPGLDLRRSVVEGYAPKVLVDASQSADLLVVGSRGHGELAGVLLGSVSEHCAAHAHCPVVVVRH